MALDDAEESRLVGGPGGFADRRGSACRFIAAATAAAFGADLNEVHGPGRGRAAAALARGAAMYLAHVGLGLTLSEVGRIFGRDRTTVAHACSRIEDCREEERFDRILACLEVSLERWRRVFLDEEAMP